MCFRYVRLELLEGVVAYHNGNTVKARESLTSAQAKYMQVFSVVNFDCCVFYYYFALEYFSTIASSNFLTLYFLTACDI